MGFVRRARTTIAVAVVAFSVAVGGVESTAFASQLPAFEAPSSDQKTSDDVTVIVRLDTQPEGATPSADDRHETVREDIAALVKESHGSSIGEGEDYYSAIDGFSITVPADAVEEIRDLDEVADAFVEREWVVEANELAQASLDKQSLSAENPADEEKSELELQVTTSPTYDGTGQLIAFLDSGLLTTHEAFSGTIDTATVALTRAESGAAAAAILAKGRAAGGAWISSKIPFALDYAGGDNNVGPQGVMPFSSHGTWIAAIAAANAGQQRGVAPQAQIAMLKIGEANSAGSVTLKDSAYLAALDDVVLLKPDVLNLSLGTPAGDIEADDGAGETYAAVFAALEEADISIVAAAGNSYDAPHTQISAYAPAAVTQPDTGILSSPATYRQALAIAAVTSEGAVPAFSSWGPAADLRLKPEISALGSNVTAADSASTSSYQDGLGGTSLATPYIAGAAAVLRQRLTESGEFTQLSVAEREALVYQFLMGTANPLTDAASKTLYSPRHQGAGRIDLASALQTLVVPSVVGAVDSSRPKAELGDGVGSWSFRVQLRNYGVVKATYEIQGNALSEKVSGGNFQRSSADWTNKGIDVKSSVSRLSVPAGATAAFTVSITPQAAFTRWASTNAPYGTFIDGFVTLRAVEGGSGAQDLTVPFLSFYGDWAAAAVFDNDIWSGTAIKSGIGLFSRERSGFIPLGANPFDMSVTSKPVSWTGKIKAERAVVAPKSGNTWNAATSQLVPDWIATRTATLRGAARLDYVLIGPDGQEKRRWSKTDVRRSNAAGSSHNSVVEADTDVATDPLFAATRGDASFPDGRYTLRLTATVAGTTRTQSRDLTFMLDSTPPTLSIESTSAEAVRVRISDATYLAATQIGVQGDDGTITYFTDKTLYSNVEPSSGSYIVTLKTADIQAAWKAAGNSGALPAIVAITAWDYAANSATVAVSLSSGQCTVATGPASFRDVAASHPFAADISWLSQRGITTGWPDGTFRPQEPVTRAAFAAFLYRMAGCPSYTPPTSSPFVDVPVTHQFYREIAWAASKGITKGWSDGTFRPEESITRDAIAAFIYRFAGSPEFTVTKTFKDSAGNEHRRAIEWLATTGISTGWSDGTYRPGLFTERGAIAAFLHRYSDKGIPIAVK